MSRPRSLRAQLLLLVLGALAVAQLASAVLFLDERRQAVGATLVQEAASRMPALAETLAEVPADTEASLLRSAGSRMVGFAIAPNPLSEAPGAKRMARLSRWLARRADAPRGSIRAASLDTGTAGARLRSDNAPPEIVALSFRLDDGRWLNATIGLRRPPLQWAWPALLSLGLTALALSLAIWWAVRGITRPMDALAGAAAALGRGETPDPLPLRGPAELRRVTARFNDMAARLTRVLADRAHMLAAIGHDLRSPVTAMRLRLEMLDDAEARERLCGSLDEIQTLVEAALALARGGGADQPREPMALDTLLASLVEEAREQGGDAVLYAGPEPLTVHAAPAALRRALRNLIENALRYGNAARITLTRDGTQARITIADDGPGIAIEDRARVFEPFVRLETSRNRDTGGTGLGLAIARAAIEGHGGTVGFEDASGIGAQVAVVLPLA